jgi:hypothetical protein
MFVSCVGRDTVRQARLVGRAGRSSPCIVHSEQAMIRRWQVKAEDARLLGNQAEAEILAVDRRSSLRCEILRASILATR